MAGHYPTRFRQLSASELAAAIGFSYIPPGTHAVMIQAVGAAVAWKDDGGTPTASEGFQLADGASLYYDLGGIPNLKFIKVSGSPVLNCQFYGSRKNDLADGLVAASLSEFTVAATGVMAFAGTASPSLADFTVAAEGTVS